MRRRRRSTTPHRRRPHDSDTTQWGILIVAKGEKQLSPNTALRSWYLQSFARWPLPQLPNRPADHRLSAVLEPHAGVAQHAPFLDRPGSRAGFARPDLFFRQHARRHRCSGFVELQAERLGQLDPAGLFRIAVDVPSAGVDAQLLAQRFAALVDRRLSPRIAWKIIEHFHGRGQFGNLFRQDDLAAGFLH